MSGSIAPIQQPGSRLAFVQLTDCADDQIQRSFMTLCPLRHRNILVCTQGLRILRFIFTAGDCSDIGTHCLRKHHGVVPQSTDTNHTDGLGFGPRTIVLQRRVNGDSTTKHWRRRCQVELLRNLDRISRRTSPKFCESTLGYGPSYLGVAVVIRRIHRPSNFGADLSFACDMTNIRGCSWTALQVDGDKLILLTLQTPLTLPARVRLRTNTHMVTQLDPIRDFAANSDNFPYNFVPTDGRLVGTQCSPVPR